VVVEFDGVDIFACETQDFAVMKLLHLCLPCVTYISNYVAGRCLWLRDAGTPAVAHTLLYQPIIALLVPCGRQNSVDIARRWGASSAVGSRGLSTQDVEPFPSRAAGR
jgi:hypothetical protein